MLPTLILELRVESHQAIPLFGLGFTTVCDTLSGLIAGVSGMMARRADVLGVLLNLDISLDAKT